MSYIALYRRFRPQTFEHVVGQDHIVRTLKNQIKTNSLSHAYLFCGTRGTGKTSCAKIFAKAVNCLNPKDGSPCGECESCKNILANGNLDILEIDAASNNRVDEIRDLREKVNYLPSVGKYKVYIIDEVHMLTDSAFNALLKTLEEPPKHIIFILATTEPQKLPATILSRCMRFDFKLVSESELEKHLAKIFAQTQTKFENDALSLIAKAGRGSVRDTLSIAERCKSFSDDNITTQSVVDCLGITDEKTLKNISEAVLNKNGGQILDIVDDLYNQGKNMTVLIDDLCEYFKNLMLAKLSSSKLERLTAESINDCKQLAQKFEAKFLLDSLKKIMEAQNQIKCAINEKVFLQTLLLSLFYDDNMELAILKNKIAGLEKEIENFQKKTLIDGDFQKKTVTQSNDNLCENKSQTSAILLQKSEILETIPQQTETFNQNVFDTQSQSKNNINADLIFGNLIAYARSQGEMRLIASMSDIESVEVLENIFVMNCQSEMCKEVINSHRNYILEYLKNQYNLSGLEIKIIVDKEKQTQSKLKELFGEKLKIV